MDSVPDEAVLMFEKVVPLSVGGAKSVSLFDSTVNRMVVIKDTFEDVGKSASESDKEKESKNLEVFKIDFLVSDEDSLKFMEAITSDEFFLRRCGNYTNQGTKFDLTQEIFEMFVKVAAEGLPNGVAALFAMLSHGDFENFGILVKTGAALQMDNNTAETSFEIFANMVEKVGIDLSEKIFKVSGYSIQEQMRYMNPLINLSETSISNIVSANDSSLFPVLRLLSLPNIREPEADLVTEITSGLIHSDWVKIGKILSDTNNFDSLFVNTGFDVEDESFDRFYDNILTKRMFTSAVYSRYPSERRHFYTELLAVAIHKVGLTKIKKAYDEIYNDVDDFIQSDVADEDNSHYIDSTMSNLSIPELVAVASNLDTGLSPLMLLTISGFEGDPSKWNQSYYFYN